jgi:hypothetical protein
LYYRKAAFQSSCRKTEHFWFSFSFLYFVKVEAGSELNQTQPQIAPYPVPARPAMADQIHPASRPVIGTARTREQASTLAGSPEK